MKRGRNPQAHKFLERMEREGLVVLMSDGAYHITDKGKELAAQYREQPQPMPEQKVEAI